MYGIFFKGVVGGEIHTATKPPGIFATLIRRFGDKTADIHVYGWHIGIARMKHQRDPNRLKAAAREFGPILGC